MSFCKFVCADITPSCFVLKMYQLICFFIYFFPVDMVSIAQENVFRKYLFKNFSRAIRKAAPSVLSFASQFTRAIRKAAPSVLSFASQFTRAIRKAAPSVLSRCFAANFAH
ncbi:MAG: hypothetical protein J6C12_12290, partial [Lachnospiraceae bacterium]|nr:hypothetical protein [Lachnospiraceae bacterium]